MTMGGFPSSRTKWRGTLGLCAVGVSTALALTACGSTSVTRPPAVKTGTSRFGTILTDSQGRTLYTLTNNGQPILCTGLCASQWPPLTVAAGARPFGAPGVGPLSTMTVSGNGNQVTWRGMALYRFIGDPSAGSTNGEGIASFGGVWHVVVVSGGGSTGGTGAATTTAPTTSTTAAGGSGY